MSNSTSTRRDALRQIALGLTAAGAMRELDAQAAQHVHSAAAAETKGGKYTPKLLNAHEWATITKLSEIVVPADERSGSAVDAGAPQFIDLLCSQNEELAVIFTGGLSWFDAEMRKRTGNEFLSASASEQTGLLDDIVAAERAVREQGAEQALFARAEQYRGFSGYTVKPGSDLAPGVRFFDWARRLIVDAYFTSPIGVKDVNYIGNLTLSKYEVPKEAIDYAFNRSPFKIV
ncbi:MAG TPA: gluconate 2-dehydrogenase subunit 3 family protein [Bryobacteraceae bacterium]|nr:gluconate 2-dehydrogenase subunit 3 family protein [Bryobacteraceae bacterium]